MPDRELNLKPSLPCGPITKILNIPDSPTLSLFTTFKLTIATFTSKNHLHVSAVILVLKKKSIGQVWPRNHATKSLNLSRGPTCLLATYSAW